MELSFQARKPLSRAHHTAAASPGGLSPLCFAEQPSINRDLGLIFLNHRWHDIGIITVTHIHALLSVQFSSQLTAVNQAEATVPLYG